MVIAPKRDVWLQLRSQATRFEKKVAFSLPLKQQRHSTGGKFYTILNNARFIKKKKNNFKTLYKVKSFENRELPRSPF